AEEAIERQARGRGKARPQVTFPVSARDRIDGQRQHVEICGHAPLDHAVGQASVLMEVQLEEFWRPDRRADLLDAYRPQGRNAEHGAEFLGGLSDRPFERKSLMLLHRSTRTGSSTLANYEATGRSLAHGQCPLKRQRIGVAAFSMTS